MGEVQVWILVLGTPYQGTMLYIPMWNTSAVVDLAHCQSERERDVILFVSHQVCTADQDEA